MYDDLGCSGDEVDFDHCHNRGIGNSDCNHYEDAGVRCGKKELSHGLYIYISESCSEIIETIDIFSFLSEFGKK